jgi:hypothetical protein
LDIRTVIEEHVLTITNDSNRATPGLLKEAINNFWATRADKVNHPSGWDLYKNTQIEFEKLTADERDGLLHEIDLEIDKGLLKKSGPHRHSDWNTGWGENLRALMAVEGADSVGALSPKYFRKHSYERLGGVHVKVATYNGIETTLLGFIVDALTENLAHKYDVRELWEFGCGTGHHLLRMRNFLPNVKLVGLDWAESSQLILQEISQRLKTSEITGENFDYFNPNFNLKPKNPDSPAIFLTVASLEQIGDRHDRFLEYVLSSGPSVVLHIEPIAEVLGDTREEQLSKKYFSARNYLSGYLTALRNLEKQGLASILSAERTGLGSMFIEGYSVVVWEPKKEKILN